MGSITIPYELVRNAEPQVLPQSFQVYMCILTRFLGGSYAQENLNKHCSQKHKMYSINS